MLTPGESKPSSLAVSVPRFGGFLFVFFRFCFLSLRPSSVAGRRRCSEGLRPESRGHPRGLGGLDLEPQLWGGGVGLRSGGPMHGSYETPLPATVIFVTKRAIVESGANAWKYNSNRHGSATANCRLGVSAWRTWSLAALSNRPRQSGGYLGPLIGREMPLSRHSSELLFSPGR
jgi:hypothetical protein